MSLYRYNLDNAYIHNHHTFHIALSLCHNIYDIPLALCPKYNDIFHPTLHNMNMKLKNSHNHYNQDTLP